jgi:hypothetical protein
MNHLSVRENDSRVGKHGWNPVKRDMSVTDLSDRGEIHGD